MTERRFLAPKVPNSPPAVWAEFARQGAWKNWVIAVQLLLLGFALLAAMGLARRPPEVVLVEEGGRSTYTSRAVAGEALLHFLQKQRSQPTDAEVLHFTREFLQAALAVNSSTVHEAWPKALSMMTPALREKWEKASSAQRLVETFQVAQVRSELQFREVTLIERTESLLHVRVALSRQKSGLTDGLDEKLDSLKVELVAQIVPRRLERPAGLEVAEWVVSEGSNGSAASAPRPSSLEVGR